MNWLRNLDTYKKLLVSFGAILLITMASGALSLVHIDTLQETISALYERDLLEVSNAKEASAQFTRIGRELRHVILSTSREDVDASKRNVDHLSSGLDDLFTLIEKDADTTREREIAAELQAEFASYGRLAHHTLTHAHDADKTEAIEHLMEARQNGVRVDALLEELCTIKMERAKVAFDESEAASGKAKTLLIAVLSVGFLFALALITFVARAISGPLTETVRVLNAMSAGDLTVSLAVQSSDEVGRMATALNAAVASIRGVLTDVVRAANQTAGAAQELSAAAEEISLGAQAQASSIEETSANLEEISATVRQNAGNAEQASKLAATSKAVAEKGGQVVGAAVDAMAEINQSSSRIADIITTIDEIAFQTNLLALNAAVEAARAGEQGRGFAVVAAEVRNLAQRSAAAAKEITSLIRDSVRKVEGGSNLVFQSGSTLSEIVASVQQVTNIVVEIASASREQSTGVDLVHKAVSQMDMVTQSNASQTEELSSTAESLSAQAQQLQDLVARFNLGPGVEITRVSAGNTKRTRATLPGFGSQLPAAPRRATRHSSGTNDGSTSGYEVF
jgi:methyl-accepting chemotaxis protein